MALWNKSSKYDFIKLLNGFGNNFNQCKNIDKIWYINAQNKFMIF